MNTPAATDAAQELSVEELAARPGQTVSNNPAHTTPQPTGPASGCAANRRTRPAATNAKASATQRGRLSGRR